MNRSELAARLLVFLLLALAVAVPVIGWDRLSQRGAGRTGTIELHARMPENGGWSLETLRAVTGQPLRLRMTSDDVLHSFAVGQSDLEPIDLKPGEWVETELVFDKPGRYTYYCTRWCGRNHWRMRGVIEVTGPEGMAPPTETPQKPLYVELGINVDGEHMAEAVPSEHPSPENGARLAAQLPTGLLTGDLFSRETYLTASPAELFLRLRAEPALKQQSDSALWDLVAYAWQRQTSPERLDAAAKLYATNCAACHGPTGQGDGVMVNGLPAFDHTAGAHGLSKPPDLSDPHSTLGASPALLQGKMLRGGMGTGMPYWGPIFTEEQINDLVAYIYTFAWQNQTHSGGNP